MASSSTSRPGIANAFTCGFVLSRGAAVAPASLLEVLCRYQRAGSVNLARAFAALEGVSVRIKPPVTAVDLHDVGGLALIVENHFVDDE